MKEIVIEILNDEKIPVKVKVGEFETPVWIQQRIVTSEYASPLNYSGCGHCSTAMALNLRGQSVAPWDEFARCVELFGEMSVSPSGNKQYPFLSVVGMVKVLTSYGLNAKAYGVNNGDRKTATKHIIEELKKGSIVNFVSCPNDDFLDNPFSKGHHWVVLAGFNKDGKVVVLNSSLGGDYKDSTLGINVVDESVIEKALSKVASPTDKTWGELENLDSEGCGYVIIE